MTYAAIEEAFGLSAGMVNTILVDDLGLVKKWARWVPKLLSDDQKQQCLVCTRDFCRRIVTDPRLLDQIVTMDESAVSFHTPESKKQFKQTPGPIKARVHASRQNRWFWPSLTTGA